MKVFVTGGTGLVGRRLVGRLLDRGDEVLLLTRDRQNAESVGLKEGPRLSLVKGDPAFIGSAWREAVPECDAVVNLAGENIFGKRWTDEHKKKLRDSRIGSTRNVVAAIGWAASALRPKVLVSASAIGYYGPREGDETLTEDAHPGDDFLARLCIDWEEAARGASAYGTRVVVLRIGVVLDQSGGALAQMVPPFKMFVGGPIGSGKQWFSWVHVDDVVGLIVHALDNAGVRGPLNATAPEPVRAGEFAQALGRVLGRPAWFKVPRFALRLKLGEVADVVASGQRVAPAAALRHGFAFRYEKVSDALDAELLQA